MRYIVGSDLTDLSGLFGGAGWDLSERFVGLFGICVKEMPKVGTKSSEFPAKPIFIITEVPLRFHIL